MQKTAIIYYSKEVMICIDCGLIYQVGRVKTSKIPLSAYQDFSAFKLYLLDVALLSAMAGTMANYRKEAKLINIPRYSIGS